MHPFPNPFFVTELLAAANDSGVLPSSVRDAMWTRVARLDGAERALLTRRAASRT